MGPLDAVLRYLVDVGLILTILVHLETDQLFIEYRGRYGDRARHGFEEDAKGMRVRVIFQNK